MFIGLWRNLNRIQKVGFVLLAQIIFIIIIVSITSFFLQDKDRIMVNDDNNQLKGIPAEEIKLYEKALWGIISQNVDNVDESIIKDVVIREGSYNEKVDEESHTVNASFLIDINSIQQTYVVYLAWISKPKIETVTPIIDCPTVEENKYPNSFCQGTYRNSYDLSLYLPYQIDSINNADYDDIGSDVYIDGDENTHTITVSLSPCDVEENKKKADAYLQTIPKIERYQINYVTKNGIDVICAEDQ